MAGTAAFPGIAIADVRALAAVTAVSVPEGFATTQPADAVTSCGSMPGECRYCRALQRRGWMASAALGCLVSEPGPAGTSRSARCLGCLGGAQQELIDVGQALADLQE